MDVIGLLNNKGASVAYHDPYISTLDDDGMKLDRVDDLMSAVQDVDCVVIITNHSNYDYPAILEAANCIVDTRNALGDTGRDHAKVVRL